MQNKTLRRSFLSVSLFLFIFLQQSLAQDYYSSTYQYKPMSFGITFAPNMGWMRYGDTEGHKSTPKFGFAYGLLADFAFTENYYFSTGLLINTLNNEAEYPSPVADPTSSVAVSLVSNEYRLQYADNPISLNLKRTKR